MLYLKHLSLTTLPMAFGLLVAVGLSGCSISDSSGSLSDSSGSIAKSSESISDSSTNDKDKDKSKPSKTSRDAAYENDVADFTITYLRTNSGRVNQNSFMKGISDIASENGIVDWEASPKTYRAIGWALKRNHVSGDLFESYKKQFGDNDAGKMEDIQTGYDGK
jgi:hypothetical protein